MVEASVRSSRTAISGEPAIRLSAAAPKTYLQQRVGAVLLRVPRNAALHVAAYAAELDDHGSPQVELVVVILLRDFA